MPLPLRVTAVVGLAGLVTGIALAIYLVARLSLAVGLAATAVLVATAVRFTWRRLGQDQRATLRRRAVAGAMGGFAATAAYDAARVVAVSLFGLRVRPFEAIPLFGQALVDAAHPSAVTTALGIVYHVANGIGFGVAFAVVAGVRGAPAGVLWALVLEAAMLTLYPGWLDVRAVREFASVSMLGHVVYGAVLGTVSARVLSGPSRVPPQAPSA